MAGAPLEVQPDELLLAFQVQQRAAFDAVPLDRQSCPGPGAKLCTYCRWFSRPADQVCPVYWKVPMAMSNVQISHGGSCAANLAGPASALASHRQVCRLCQNGADDERHMLLEGPALADVRDKFSVVADCSGVMVRLVRYGPESPPAHQ